MADVDIQVELVAAPEIQVELAAPVEINAQLASPVEISVDVAARGPQGATGAQGPAGADGADGADGQGVPVGGTTGQVLAKATATDYDTEWVDAASGGGGAVDSVNSQTGTVVLDADDIDDTSTTHKFVTASDLTTLSNTSGTNTGDQDLSSYATTAAVAAGYQPLDADLTALAALTSPATKLSGIEANADVTDTTNVTAAGALMDSEVANLAAVKAFDPTDYATAAQGALADTALQSGDVTAATIDTEASADGYVLTSDGAGNAAWEAVSGSGTVTSVAQTVPTGFTVAGSPVTGSGTLAISYDTGYQGYTTTEAGKLSNIEANADVTDATNVDAAGAVMNSDTSTASMSFVVDEDDMTSNSATKVPTQQSVKAYVDNEITAAGGYNDEAAQDAVGTILTDSAEIDFTYNDATPSITASIVAGSIDETKLDTSVNASLDLADSATQPGDLATVATTGAYSDLTGTPTIPTVSDTAYDATSWNGNTDAPTKNAVRDKIESMGSGSGDVTGPASSTDNAVPLYDGATGKLLKNSDITYSGVTLTLPYILRSSTDVGFSLRGNTSVNFANTDGTIRSSIDMTNSTFTIDTIEEQTAASGVTVDGVLIKDGEVDGRDIATDGSKLDGIEAGADVTDATNVAATGAYMSGGTDVALADGGTGASLTDPNADRIMFWDDSAGAVTWLTPSTGLTVSGTNMTVRTSSATQTGIVELATTAETTTATDTARAVTPAGIGAERSATATLTNKTLTTPTIAQINSSTGVKAQLDTQTDNNDSISSAQTAGVRVQYGWGQAQGTNTSTITDAVTFPTAFSTVLGVTVSWGGNKAGSGTDITAFTGATVAAFTSIGWSSPTTTGFDVTMTRSSGAFANTSYYAYSWIAWGI